MIDPVVAATSSRVKGLHVLLIHDTTCFRDDSCGNSLVGHASIAVAAEQGALLGLLDTKLIERREDASMVTVVADQGSFEVLIRASHDRVFGGSAASCLPVPAGRNRRSGLVR